ncbi:MAG: hypothetical protein ABIH23_27960 [bacterium]
MLRTISPEYIAVLRLKIVCFYLVVYIGEGLFCCGKLLDQWT